MQTVLLDIWLLSTICAKVRYAFHGTYFASPNQTAHPHMRSLILAVLVTISFAFKAGDAEVEVQLLDICSLESAQETARIQQLEEQTRIAKQARQARRAEAKAAAAEQKRAEKARLLAEEQATRQAAARISKAAMSIAPRKAIKRRDGTPVSSATIDSLLRLATSLEGVRYTSGGNSVERGFDCSGFVYYVFKKFGFSVDRSSRDQATMGREIKREDARPGDIIVFSRNGKRGGVFHAGLIVESTDQSLVMVHSNQREGVHQLDIDQCSYWSPKVHSIRRVL